MQNMVLGGKKRNFIEKKSFAANAAVIRAGAGLPGGAGRHGIRRLHRPQGPGRSCQRVSRALPCVVPVPLVRTDVVARLSFLV